MQNIMGYAICANPYTCFPMRFQSFLLKIFMLRTWQYNRYTEWTAKKTTGMCVCMCQLLPQNRITHYKCKILPIKLLLKQHPVVSATSLECAKDFHAKNMAKQFKLQLSLFEME